MASVAHTPLQFCSGRRGALRPRSKKRNGHIGTIGPLSSERAFHPLYPTARQEQEHIGWKVGHADSQEMLPEVSGVAPVTWEQNLTQRGRRQSSWLGSGLRYKP